MNKQLAKIGNIVLDVLVIIILIVSLTIAVSSAASKNNDGVPTLFGYTILSVQTDSMDPTIKAGDIIIGRVSDKDTELKKGDIITFKSTPVEETGIGVIKNTHRIVAVDTSSGAPRYNTQGDNVAAQDHDQVRHDQVISKYTGVRIPKLGGVIDFLKSGIGFFVFLLIPVIVFFIFYFIKFIKNLSAYNKEKNEELAQMKAAELDEEQKKKIIEEYLKAQQNGDTPENKPEEKPDDEEHKE